MGVLKIFREREILLSERKTSVVLFEIILEEKTDLSGEKNLLNISQKKFV